MHTFLWHDYETFGLDTRRDRPAQFAGIRTDADLNEIGEPIELYCQPQAGYLTDYLPDPTSCLLTGITPQRCIERGIPEFEFARRIEAELGTTGTIGVGYNTIRFDDEVTRHLFWRNLIDPYSREWRNQCGRWDILDLVRAAYALRPGGINWPTTTNDQGETRYSFKLELLTAANGIAHEAAHDAVSDVRATIALARLIKQQQPKLFDFYLALHKKDRVLAELGLPAAPAEARPFLHVSGMFPAERGCLAVMWPLCTHPTNKNEILAWDLSAVDASGVSIDPRCLLGLKADEIRQRLFSKSADLPEGISRLPIKSVHINKSPFVLGQLKMLTPELQQKWGINLAECLAMAEHAQQLPDMSWIWGEVYARPKLEDAEPTDVDAALYEGFTKDADRRTLLNLLKQSPEALAQRQPAFEDPRLDEVFWRYRCRNFAEALSPEDFAKWRQHCRDRLVNGVEMASVEKKKKEKKEARTLAQYFANIDTLEASLDGASEASQAAGLILRALRAYGETIQSTLDSSG
jgi:exodeoxyribonuclease-1